MNTNIKICLVEDDEADYMLFKSYLKKTGNDYELEWFENYQDGLNAIKNRNHDIYFIDYTLDSNTGLDLVRESLENNNLGPFIILTGSDNPKLYKKLSKSGVYDYILKGELSTSLIDRCITYSLERERHESALRKEKEFTSNIIREVPYMVIGVSDGKIAFANPATVDISGFDEYELMGRDWKSLFADDGEDNFNFFIEGDGNASFKKNIVTASGEERIIQWNILDRYMIRDEHSNINLVLSGKDITSEIKEQRQKRQKDKMESLGHLAGGVAHEINNLLLPIHLGAELIQAKAKDDETIIDTTEKILRNAKAAASIVDDILIFSRRDKNIRTKQNLNTVFDNAMNVVTALLPASVELNIKSQDVISNAECMVDEKDMIRILSNILINAAHAMDDGGCIKIGFEKSTIKDSDFGQKNAIQMQISDSGCGIDKDLQDRIFDPFFTTKDVGHGTGLGLSIVYNIVTSWGGDIAVNSSKNKGTTFTILIPLA